MFENVEEMLSGQFYEVRNWKIFDKNTQIALIETTDEKYKISFCVVEYMNGSISANWHKYYESAKAEFDTTIQFLMEENS